MIVMKLITERGYLQNEFIMQKYFKYKQMFCIFKKKGIIYARENLQVFLFKYAQ